MPKKMILDKIRGFFKISPIIKISLILGFLVGIVQSGYKIHENQYFEYSFYNLSLYLTQKTVNLWIVKIALSISILFIVRYLIINKKKLAFLLLISASSYSFIFRTIIFTELHKGVSVSVGTARIYGLLISVFAGWLVVYGMNIRIGNTDFWKKLTFKLSSIVLLSILVINCAAFLGKWTSKPKPNIVIILIDTLRNDHLGAYGYKKNTSPSIDKMAREGVLFNNCFAQSPSTKASIASIFTSKYPSQHNVILNRDALDESFVTIAEALKDKGYKTAGFVTNNNRINSHFNYDQGFEEWSEFKNEPINKMTAKKITDTAIPWLEKNSEKPFFLYLHYYDPHTPYQAPEPYKNFFDKTYKGNVNGSNTDLKNIKFFKENPKELEHLISLYDSEIRYVDSEIKKFFDKLKELNIMDESLIILTSDHGEGFLEHDNFFHSYGVYSELINVPLIIRYPKIFKANQKSNIYVQHIDFFPFLMDVLAFKSKKGVFEGKSFLSLRQTNNAILSEHLRKGKSWGFPQRGLIYKGWKLIKDIFSDHVELFDIRKSSDDINDVSKQKPKITSALKKKLSRMEKKLAKTMVRSPKVKLNRQMKERLKSLGYIN